MPLFLLFISFFFLSNTTALFAQGTEFITTPEPPPPIKEAPKPKPQVKTEPKPRPQPKPKRRKEQKRSISDIIFLMDISGSMKAPTNHTKRVSKLEEAQQALVYFADHMHPGARFQLWTFNERLHQPNKSFKDIGKLQSKTRQVLKQKIQEVDASGGTHLYEALYEAIEYFQSNSYVVPSNVKRRLKIIVVLADGQDDEVSRIQLPHVLRLKQKHPDVQIKTIGYGIEDDSPFHEVLCQLASQNECLNTQNPQSLKELIRSFTKS